LQPFTRDAVNKIGEISEFNAAKMLRMAYDLLDRAVSVPNLNSIDENFINDNRGRWDSEIDDQPHTIDTALTTDLIGKATGQE
jgi:hypothetical protein